MIESLDRDALNAAYAAPQPWCGESHKQPLAGKCEQCGEELGAYESKWVKDGHIVCRHHWWRVGVFNPSPGWRYYTDG
jgi:hypothetical protein